MAVSRHPIVEHIPRLRRYARALRGNAADADDLVQDTLERAYAKWHFWKAGRELRPWLFAIMHNVFVNQLERRGSRGTDASLDEVVEPGAPARQELAGEVLDVAAALAKLTPAQREVLLLVALEELSYAEAARVLKVPVGTVMSRLWAARTNMRKLTGGAAETAPESEQVTP